MGKTHEALEWAEKEYQANREETLPVPLPARKVEPYKRRWIPPPVGPYEDLKTNLLSRYRDGSIKTILFAGTGHGDGASTTAANFAIAVARDSRLKILLLDVNLRTPSLHDIFKIDPDLGMSDLMTKNGRRVRPVRMGPGKLDVISCGIPSSEPLALFESDGFDRFLKRTRDRFDYVVLDAPPIHGSSECRVLCAKVDGVVLVIESGKTRRQAALSAKKQLDDAGAKILGVVLNKRRFYIPGFIYRRL